MIQHFYVSRAAYFYRRKTRLSNAAIDRLFRMLRLNAVAPSKNLFSAHRVELEHSTYSAIYFSFERSPAFLTSQAEAVERVFGFLMIVEKGNLVAVLKAGLDLPPSFKSDHLDKIGSDRVDREKPLGSGTHLAHETLAENESARCSGGDVIDPGKSVLSAPPRLRTGLD